MLAAQGFGSRLENFWKKYHIANRLGLERTVVLRHDRVRSTHLLARCDLAVSLTNISCTSPDDGLRIETCSGGNRGEKRFVALTVS
jgi:hypothetical protein